MTCASCEERRSEPVIRHARIDVGKVAPTSGAYNPANIVMLLAIYRDMDDTTLPARTGKLWRFGWGWT